MTDREFKQQSYIRICRDSNFKMAATDAAIFAAKLINCHPFDILIAIGDYKVMKRIADGSHPIVNKEK